MVKMMRVGLAAACLVTGAAGAQTPAPVKTLVDYKAELKLSDAQISQVRAAVKAFQEQAIARQQKLEASEKQLEQLIAQHAALDAISAKLREAEDERMNLRFLDVVTSRKIEGILTPAQLKQWNDIQKQVRSTQPKARQ